MDEKTTKTTAPDLNQPVVPVQHMPPYAFTPPSPFPTGMLHATTPLEEQVRAKLDLSGVKLKLS